MFSCCRVDEAVIKKLGRWSFDVAELNYFADFHVRQEETRLTDMMCNTHCKFCVQWKSAMMLAGHHNENWDNISEMKTRSWCPRWFLELDEQRVQAELTQLVFPFMPTFRSNVQKVS